MNNLDAIAKGAAAECVRQHVGVFYLGRLITAFATAQRDWADEGITHGGIINIANIVDPINKSGYRRTPVTFANGGGSVAAPLIPSAMDNLFNGITYLLGAGDIDTIVKEFLYIHPFADGNGRTGWILYNFLKGTMENPLTLPNYFGE